MNLSNSKIHILSYGSTVVSVFLLVFVSLYFYTKTNQIQTQTETTLSTSQLETGKSILDCYRVIKTVTTTEATYTEVGMAKECRSTLPTYHIWRDASLMFASTLDSSLENGELSFWKVVGSSVHVRLTSSGSEAGRPFVDDMLVQYPNISNVVVRRGREIEKNNKKYIFEPITSGCPDNDQAFEIKPLVYGAKLYQTDDVVGTTQTVLLQIPTYTTCESIYVYYDTPMPSVSFENENSIIFSLSGQDFIVDFSSTSTPTLKVK